MNVKKISINGDRSEIAAAVLMTEIKHELDTSRFIARLDPKGKGFTILDVRLRLTKPYCGNHPNACELGGERSRRGRYLEGADWVEFNDLLNNVCDRLHAHANIRSNTCIVRKQDHRRIVYGSYRPRSFGNYQWRMDGPDWHYRNNCGMAPMVSDFPDGTPGIYAAIGYDVEG